MNDNNGNTRKPKPLVKNSPPKVRFSIDESSPLVDIKPIQQAPPLEANPRRKDKRGVRTFGYLRTRFDRDVNKTTD